ncbi:hypothetical protein LINPERHAP1_LOCUS35054 [Linum perenne]
MSTTSSRPWRVDLISTSLWSWPTATCCSTRLLRKGGIRRT